MWLTDLQSKFPNNEVRCLDFLYEILICKLEVGVAFCSGGRYDRLVILYLAN